MMLRLPHPGRKARWMAVFYGLLVFLWLSPEDNHPLPVVLLGVGGSLLSVIYWAGTRLAGREIPAAQTLVLGPVLGAVCGISASLITTTLMLIKNARHAHLFPDYPPGQMGAILARAPVWAAAGALIGLGLALAWLALRKT